MPSRTRSPRASAGPWTARSHGHTRVGGIVLGLCAILAALATLPTAADASGGCAPKLGRVKSFDGRAAVDFQTSATGEIPGSGGSETVVLDHNMDNVRFHLRKVAGHKGFRRGNVANFVGVPTHGDVEVSDEFANSGSAFGGTQTYSGPLLGHRPDFFGAASLAIDRRKSRCQYEFLSGFAVPGAFSGDEEIEPESHVGGAAYGPLRHIPASLKLHGVVALPAQIDCGEAEVEGLVSTACYEMSGGWTTDFATLALCHSIVAVGCAADTTKVGTAEFEWSVWPIFKKHHKKKK